MKKIFIYSYNLELGGIERSLLGLLSSIDYTRYSVDLFLVKHEGELFKLIPDKVNLLPQNNICSGFGVSVLELYKKKQFFIAAVRTYGKVRALLQRKILHKNISAEYIGQLVYPIIMNKLQNNSNQYDLAISFCWPHYYTIYNINAKIKIGWIHTDYTQIFPDLKKDKKMWDELDYIAGVSEQCVDSFLKIFPEMKSRTIVVENILSPTFVKQQSGNIDVSKEIPNEEGIINICSIGRFTYAKNFDNVPFICKNLMNLGFEVRWYLIGFGGDEKLIKEKIIEAGMQKQVIILGKKENPYPYLKACDIYVQPSRFEGKAVTVREAQILCKPVVITNFATAQSQLINGEDGIIVPMDNNGCANSISRFIRNKDLQNKIISNMKLKDYSNKNEIRKIYEVII